MKCSIHHDLFRTVTTRETKKMKRMMGQEMRKEEDTHRLLSRAYYNQSTHHRTTKTKNHVIKMQ